MATAIRKKMEQAATELEAAMKNEHMVSTARATVDHVNELDCPRHRSRPPAARTNTNIMTNPHARAKKDENDLKRREEKAS